MRCYFMREGRIHDVEVLTAADEAAQISEAHTLFRTRGKVRQAEGFEVWDQGRLVYRFPESAMPRRKPRSVARLLKLWDRMD